MPGPVLRCMRTFPTIMRYQTFLQIYCKAYVESPGLRCALQDINAIRRNSYRHRLLNKNSLK